MNHIRWAAWGVVDIEALERMQRRNYIKRVRSELGVLGIELECGGSKQQPYYLVSIPDTYVKKHYAVDVKKHHAIAGKDAFRKVCEWTLHATGDWQQLEKERMDNVSSEDGGVRRTGTET